VVRGLDPATEDEDLFRVEPFCGIVSETALPEADPADFLAAATTFMNERLWGTLNATIVVPPDVSRDTPEAVEAAIDRLRYGTVSVNHWPAVAFALMTAPWGGHPTATLQDVQSGLGWVHNTFLLDGAEKTVLRGPFRPWPDPVWFVDNDKSLPVSAETARFETDPGWRPLAGVLAAFLR
jgi:aldehyde dehydrogenase (NAD(P)+)